MHKGSNPRSSVKQGKNREFSQNHPIIGPIRPSNSLVSLVFWIKFPKHRNREYFQWNREFNSWNRELSGWIREAPYGPPQLQIGERNRLSLLIFAAGLPKIR